MSVDLFYEARAERAAHDALAVEMEAAALFAVGAEAGVPVACILAVSDTFDRAGARRRIADEELRTAAESDGRAPRSPRSRRERSRQPLFLAFARAGRFGLAGRLCAGLCRAARGARARRALRGRRRRSRVELLAQRRELLLDRRQARLEALGESARSRRWTPSSMPSSRWETERSRRVSRSMSAADGMFSAPIATSCAWAALSRASNARADRPRQQRVFQQRRTAPCQAAPPWYR